MLLLIVSSTVVVGAVMLTKGAYPHYAAPVTGILLVLVLEGLRRLNKLHSPQVHGPTLAVLILLAYPPYLALRPSIFGAEEARSFAEKRNGILEALQEAEGEDLAIVRYGEGHNFHREWVYNRALIDSADVVWAREMSPEENRELVRYFEGRRAWLLEVDESVRLRPYSEDLPEP